MPAAIADYKAVLAQAQVKLDEAKTILTNPTATAEDKGKVEGLMAEFKTLRTQATQLQNDSRTLDDIAQYMQDMKSQDTPATGTGFNGGSADPDYTDVPPGSDFKSIYGFMKALITRRGQRGAPGPLVKGLRMFNDLADKAGMLVTKDMAESVGASGGFLVTPEYLTSVMAKVAEMSLMRSRATIIRMRRREINIPVLDQTGTTAGQPHWFGGIQSYWTEEASQKNESDPTFRQMALIAYKLALYTRVSDELLDDSVIALTDWLMGPFGFPGEMAWREDYAFLRGTGVGQPLGILNSGALVTVPRAVQHSVTYPDITNMVQNFLPNGRGMWIASQSLLSSLLQMAGPASNPIYVWGPGPIGQTALGAVPATLLGYPIYFTEKLPYLGTTGDLLLVDPSYYLIGDRQSVTIESTIYDRFQYDQTSFRCVERIGGRPWLSSPFTLADATQTVSPFVALAAKSTS